MLYKKKVTFLAILLLLITGACENIKPDKLKDQNRLQEVIKPNIILILVDDLGYADVGFNGCEDIPTPNIDRIAANGVQFTDAYVSYAVCGPSRAGLITGRYQDRFGYARNPVFAPNDTTQGLPLSEQTMASLLSEVGYRNQALGKWHLGSHESQRPLERGFDEFFGFLSGGHRYFPSEYIYNNISEVKGQWEPYRTKLLRNNQRIEETEYLTDAISREAVSFIERSNEDPFFIYLAYNAPHAPLQATKKYLDRFDHIENEKRRTYAAMVSAVDDGVGDVLDKLNELELTENTIVFFLSDNGGPEKANSSDNDPLRGGKGDLFEGGVRVPFAMQWEGHLPKGRISNKPIISLDIFSTVARISGATPKNKIDGIDLISYVIGEEGPVIERDFFWRKYDSNQYAVRSENFKLIKTKDNNSPVIFDLYKDLTEANPLQPTLLDDRLKGSYDKWNSQMIKPAFLGLKQEEEYNRAHPDRYVIEPY